jgi:hypothetical protein
VSDERCSEILGSLPHVVEWAEAEPEDEDEPRPLARSWVGIPRSTLVRKGAPAPAPHPSKLPAPPSKPSVLPRDLVDLRRHHLPEKLPHEWSPPLAVPEQRMWMIEVDDLLVLVGFCSVGAQVKLMVCIIWVEELTDNQALAVLGKFRGVREFVPEPGEADHPNCRMYLGELTAGDYAVAMRAPAPKTLN